MMMLQLSEFGNPSAQATLGTGVGGTNNDWVDWQTPLSWPMGATKSLGDRFGNVPVSWTNSAGTVVQNACHVSLMGIEDPYMLQWEMCQGIYCGSSNNSAQDGTEIFIYEGNRMPSSSELATHPEGDYRQLTRLTTEGYISQMIIGEYFDILAKKLGAGGTSGWGDYNYANSTGQLVLWGAFADVGACAGLGYAGSVDAWSTSRSNFGSRLAYYGELTFMSGAELVASV